MQCAVEHSGVTTPSVLTSTLIQVRVWCAVCSCLCRLPSAKPFVLAQRYVSDPLLIDGCKFGIRLWLLVTGVEPFTAYVHNQGLVLFSTDRCGCMFIVRVGRFGAQLVLPSCKPFAQCNSRPLAACLACCRI